MWTVYVLECADGTFYTGIAKNFEARLKAHTDGKGAKYTQGRGPFQVHHTEIHSSRSEASKREWQIKQLKRSEKAALGGR